MEGDEEQRYEEEDCNNDLKILRSEKGADEKGDAGHDLAEDDPSFPLSIFHICEFLDEGSWIIRQITFDEFEWKG